MSGFLFSDVIFGPVHSRRLGVSLGINLLPTNYKFCTFNCIYCECGWTHDQKTEDKKLPDIDIIRYKLEAKLKRLLSTHNVIDAITFAGNGEPTIHPKFPEIIDLTISLRDKYFPEAKVTVLSNASYTHKEKVINALRKVDKNMLKLDAGTEETFQKINQPNAKVKLKDIVDFLKSFNGDLIIQSLFLEGEIDGGKVSNITNEEIDAYIQHLKEIKPRYVMVYPIDRQTPLNNIRKLSFSELNAISRKIEEAGFKTQVYG